MLAIRLQRTGRKGHAQFRIIVQDAQLSPKSGKVVALLGSYNPHAKTVTIDKEKAAFYLEHGAQPSERAVSLLKQEKVKLPKWVEKTTKKEGKIRNPDKLRKNRPAEPKAPAEAPAEPESEKPSDEVIEDQPAADTPAPAEEPTEATEAPVEDVTQPETPAEPAAEADTAEVPTETAE